MPSKAADFSASVSRRRASAGSRRRRMATTAATCIAVGKTSLEDWPRFTSSLGCTRRPSPRAPPMSSLARLARTSFMFMLLWVPEPVCQTTRGNSSGHLPASTSSAAAEMDCAFSAVSAPREKFTVAHARLIQASASMTSRGMRSPEMRKCSSERWVCAPQRCRSGTSIGPKVSFSIRVSPIPIEYIPKGRSQMNRKYLAAAAAAAAAALVPAVAQTPKAEDQIKLRKAAYSLMGYTFGSLDAMASGKRPMNKAEETRARPEIWTKLADFDAKMDKMVQETGKLAQVARGGDAAALKKAVADVDTSCSNCHEDFRVKRRG